MKKKIISLLLTVIYFLSCYTGIADAAGSAKVNVYVQLKSIECVENNHVGNEWGFSCTVNSKELQEGNSVEIKTTSSSKIKIVSEATEYDKYPDSGTKTLSIPVSKIKSNKNNTYTSKVTVTENRGRYSGNSAVWLFTFIINKK
jgi:hypothetical protein